MFVYEVFATVNRKEGEWTRSTQVATFYLYSEVQGIQDEEQAMRVAARVVNPFDDPNITVHGYATKFAAS